MSLDATFLFIFLSFVVFTLLMRAIFFAPVQRIKTERERAIADARESAVALVAQRERLSGDYERELIEARRKAQQLILEFRQNAKKSAGETVVEARNKAAGEIDRQLRELSQWREEAYAKLAGDRNALARIIVEKVTAGKLPAASVEH